MPTCKLLIIKILREMTGRILSKAGKKIPV
jgi:hypothetical protein